MNVKVNNDACIGSGACCAIWDAVFEIGDERISVVKKKKVEDESEKEAVREAVDACPTGAIEVEE